MQEFLGAFWTCKYNGELCSIIRPCTIPADQSLLNGQFLVLPDACMRNTALLGSQLSRMSERISERTCL